MLGIVAEAVAATVTAVEFFKQWAGKAKDGAIQGTLADDIWQGLQDRVGAHAMENYRKKLVEFFKSE